jgi:hypothetical protein
MLHAVFNMNQISEVDITIPLDRLEAAESGPVSGLVSARGRPFDETSNVPT